MAKKSTTRKTTKAANAQRSQRSAKTVVTVEDTSRTKVTNNNQEIFDKIRTDLNKNKSFMNLALGAVILLITGLLLFNYFSKNNQGQKDLGPSQQTDTQQSQQSGDVAKDNLPGKYTIKQGDTLFTIAQNYYGDGYKYPEIVKANKMADENNIEVGQVIEIPKIEGAQPSSSPSESPSMSPSASVSANPSQTPEPQTMNQSNPDNGQGGATNQTMWGEKITGNTYTVQAGDWLSKIAGRTYGDVMAYEKIAQANNITDPNNIEVGTVLKIPR